MDNLATQAILGTQDTGRRQTKTKGKQLLPLIRHPPGYLYIQDMLDTHQTKGNTKIRHQQQTTGRTDEPNIERITNCI